MSANVETMFSANGVTPWHGLGTIIQDAPTSEDAIRIAGLDWEVYKTTASYMGADGQQYYAPYEFTIRSSDSSVLGVVTDRYKIVQNNEAFAFTDHLLNDGVVKYETAGSLDNGKTIWLLARMEDHKVLGDTTTPFLLFTNSHDGKGAVRVTMTPVRVVCQNTLNLALSKANRTWSFTHTGDIDFKMMEARATITGANEYINSFEEHAEELAKIKVSKQQLDTMLDLLFPIDEDMTKRKQNNMQYLRDGFMEKYNTADLANQNSTTHGTGWGVVNAMSDFVTHSIPLRHTEKYRENLAKSFIGGNTLLDACHNWVQSVV